MSCSYTEIDTKLEGTFWNPVGCSLFFIRVKEAQDKSALVFSDLNLFKGIPLLIHKSEVLSVGLLNSNKIQKVNKVQVV